MTTRWNYEAAIERSGLKPLTRLVLATIARNADARTGMIPARYMPSAASLASRTGLSERRVRDHLKLAEEAGWLIIEQRPGLKAMLALAIPGHDLAAEVDAEADVTPDAPAPTPDIPPAEAPDVPSDVSDPFAQTKKTQISLSGSSLTDVLSAAVPDAGEREIEAAVTEIQARKAQGSIRSERAYLRTLIANGDACAFVAECRPPQPVTWTDADYRAGWGSPEARGGESAGPCEHGSPGGGTRNQFGVLKCPLCRMSDAYGVPVPARAA